MTVCNDDIISILEKKLLFINRRWKEITDLIKVFVHDESIKKKQEDFHHARLNILDTLEKIEREIQEYLPCTIKALKDQENRLYVKKFF